jgi:agmatine deiminase
MPSPVLFEGEVLPASYANFLITNGAVLVPIFNDAADKLALSLLQSCFPGRKVIGIYARDLVWGLGTIHCLTQQEPIII